MLGGERRRWGRLRKEDGGERYGVVVGLFGECGVFGGLGRVL